MSIKSSTLLARLSELQSDAALAVGKILKANNCPSNFKISTAKETYQIKFTVGKATILSIDDGMDTYTEFTIDVSELLEILENLEEMFRIDD